MSDRVRRLSRRWSSGPSGAAYRIMRRSTARHCGHSERHLQLHPEPDREREDSLQRGAGRSAGSRVRGGRCVGRSRRWGRARQAGNSGARRAALAGRTGIGSRPKYSTGRRGGLRLRRGIGLYDSPDFAGRFESRYVCSRTLDRAWFQPIRLLDACRET